MSRAAAPALASAPDFETTETAPRSRPFAGRLRRFATEPLLHFALLGGSVFALQHALSRTPAAATLEVSTAKQRELGKLFEQRQHRAPSTEERAQLVRRYVEDEALFREGLRLSLLQTDPMLRAQLVARVRSLLQAEVTEKPPEEAEVRHYYEQHAAEYSSPATISYREYLFPTGPQANDGARRLSLALQRGEEPVPAGAPNPVDHSRENEAELAALQGPDFARRLWSLPSGVWRELPSSRGVHVVRVDDHAAASNPPFESVREQVQTEYRRERTARAFQREVERLTATFQVKVEEQP